MERQSSITRWLTAPNQINPRPWPCLIYPSGHEVLQSGGHLGFIFVQWLLTDLPGSKAMELGGPATLRQVTPAGRVPCAPPVGGAGTVSSCSCGPLRPHRCLLPASSLRSPARHYLQFPTKPASLAIPNPCLGSPGV